MRKIDSLIEIGKTSTIHWLYPFLPSNIPHLSSHLVRANLSSHIICMIIYTKKYFISCGVGKEREGKGFLSFVTIEKLPTHYPLPNRFYQDLTLLHSPYHRYTFIFIYIKDNSQGQGIFWGKRICSKCSEECKEWYG